MVLGQFIGFFSFYRYFYVQETKGIFRNRTTNSWHVNGVEIAKNVQKSAKSVTAWRSFRTTVFQNRTKNTKMKCFSMGYVFNHVFRKPCFYVVFGVINLLNVNNFCYLLIKSSSLLTRKPLVRLHYVSLGFGEIRISKKLVWRCIYKMN